MQSRDNEIFWTRAKGITLTPEDPLALMVWSFEKIARNSYRSADLSPREHEVALAV